MTKSVLLAIIINLYSRFENYDFIPSVEPVRSLSPCAFVPLVRIQRGDMSLSYVTGAPSNG